MKAGASNQLLLDGFYNYMVAERRLAPNTVESYSRDLDRYLVFIAQEDALPLGKCTRSDLTRFLSIPADTGAFGPVACTDAVEH